MWSPGIDPALFIKIDSTQDLTIQLMQNTIFSPPKINKWKNNKLNVVIPMAGNGSRFIDAGFYYEPGVLVSAGLYNTTDFEATYDGGTATDNFN